MVFGAFIFGEVGILASTNIYYSLRDLPCRFSCVLITCAIFLWAVPFIYNIMLMLNFSKIF